MDNNSYSSVSQPVTASNSKKYAAASISIKDILLVCLSKWYYFAITVALALLVAFLYISSTAPTYQSSACLLLKQDRRSGSSGIEAASSGFSNVGRLFTQQSNVFNEIIAFASPALMEEVVRRLDLRADYTTKCRMYQKTLYGSTLPLTVSMIDFPDNSSMGFVIRYKDNNSVELAKMYSFINGKKVGCKGSFTVNFRDTVDTPVGRLVILPKLSFYDLKSSFPDINLTYVTLGSAVGRHKGQLSVSQTDKEATALTLVKADKSPERARDILSTLIDVYNEKWVRDQNQIAVSTSEFINDRLIVIEKELGNVDSDISRYKSSHQLLDPEATGNMYLSRASRIRDNITDIENKLTVAEYIRSYVQSSATGDRLLPANTGIDNTNIEGSIAEYNNLQLQKSSLIKNSSVDSPVLLSLEDKLQAMKENILESIDNYIAILRTQIEAMQTIEESNASKISINPMQVEHLTDIQRQQKVKESLYLYLLQKREENELGQAFTAYNTRLLTPPSSGVPVAPQKSRIILMALLIGLALPAGWIYLIESTNTTVRGRQDVECLSAPFCGEIPLAYQRNKYHLPFHKSHESDEMLVVKAKNRDVINEAFRVARTNLEFICNSKDCDVLMTTSFNVGSGKSFISLNMAVALALKSKKVCIVDMDLRKRTISRYVKAGKAKGVTEYLSHKVEDLDSLIIRGTLADTLDVLPSGTIPPNPTELLYSDNMQKMIENLRKEYDYVLMDCPPVEIVADASIIGPYADHTFFVVRAGLLDRSMLPVLDRYYDTKKYNGMIVFLNGTDINSRTSYNRYGYGYGYGYVHSYGYGHAYGYGGSAYGLAYGEDETDEKKVDTRKKS